MLKKYVQVAYREIFSWVDIDIVSNKFKLTVMQTAGRFLITVNTLTVNGDNIVK